MWYIELDGTLLPTPYQRYEDCMAEIKRLQKTMIGVCLYPVLK